MKTFKQYFCNYTFIIGLLAIAACKPEIHKPAPSKGSADFSTYIAIGNSLTAGYADGGLYREGQLNSYPNIMATQMQAVGGGVFNQPLFTTAQANGSGYLQLAGFNADGTPKLDTVTSNLAIRNIETIPGFGPVTLYTKYSGAINNYGVPGIKLLDLTYAPYANFNGYFERLLPDNSPNITTDYLSFITAKPFTFFSNWLGNNDALLFATSGGAGDVLTDQTQFAELYTALVSTMTAKGAKGVCATIPNVTSIPYFNTVTEPAVLAAVKAKVPTVDSLYINALVSGTPATSTTASTAVYKARGAKANDLFVLGFPTSKIGTPVNVPGVPVPVPYGLSPYAPIDNQYVLDQAEAALTLDYVNSYNATIKAVAASKGLAVFDAFTFLNNVKATGLLVNGVSLNSNYITGGLFSLDGVHLTPRGYAIVANEFIKAINKQYGSSIPLANVSSYPGVKFP